MVLEDLVEDLDVQIRLSRPMTPARELVASVTDCFASIGLHLDDSEPWHFGKIARPGESLEIIRDLSTASWAKPYAELGLIFKKGRSRLVYRCRIPVAERLLVYDVFLEAVNLGLPSKIVSQQILDRFDRLHAVSVVLAKRLGASWAICPSKKWRDLDIEPLFRIEGESMFRYFEPELTLATKWPMIKLCDWVEDLQREWIRVDRGTILLETGKGELALVLNHLWDGRQIPISPPKRADFLEWPSSEQEKWVHQGWLADSLEDVIRNLGPPDERLGGPDDEAFKIRRGVNGILFYWGLSPSFVVIFRGYDSGWVAVNFAAKRRSDKDSR